MKVRVGEIALELTDDQVRELRQQLSVEPLTACERFLTTAEAAERIGFSAEYVRDHARELGGEKAHDGPRARWRFDPAKLSFSDLETSAGAPNDAPRPRRQRRVLRAEKSEPLLRVRG
jgi:hypothetical protein